MKTSTRTCDKRGRETRGDREREVGRKRDRERGRWYPELEEGVREGRGTGKKVKWVMTDLGLSTRVMMSPPRCSKAEL